MQAHRMRARSWFSAGISARLLTHVALACSLAACAGSGPKQVVNVATHDLGCSQVDIAALEGQRYAAYGCGKGAVYAQVCDQGGCRWGRLRHGHELSVAATSQPTPETQPRQVLPAPAPPGREIIPAPPPDSGGQREVLPAPAQGQQGAPSDSPLQSGAAPAPQPLSQGELSAPYQAEVPAQPVAQQVAVPPPQPLVETRPPPPAYNHVWISGYWWWGPRAYWTWVPGYWTPPYYGYSYVPGSWYWSAGYWWYGPGGWARPGTTIIVNRNIPPRPSRVATVRTFTPHRVVRDGGSRNSAPPGRLVRAPSGANKDSFTPRSSPLIAPERSARPGAGYSGLAPSRVTPGAADRSRLSSPHYVSPSGSRYGAPSVGRVVTPGASVRPRADFTPRGGSSFDRSSAPAVRPSGGSYRTSPGPHYSPSGGGGRSFSGGGGGGGGRSFGGGGGGGMAPVRVSPGGGRGR